MSGNGVRTMTQIYAHRGSSGTRPENTLPSFSEAIRAGADAIELDVHLSKDQQLVVIHDEEVDRTTNGKGLVREKTLAELKQLNAGSWFSTDFKAAKIPTLKEVLDLLLQRNYRGLLLIEIKTDKFEYPGIEEKVSALMTAGKWPFTHAYCSFNLKSLERMAVLEPDVQLDYVVGTSEKKVVTAMTASILEGLHPKKDWVNQHLEQAQDFPIAVRPWVVNDTKEMTQYFNLNVKGIITDFPERAQLIQQSLKK